MQVVSTINTIANSISDWPEARFQRFRTESDPPCPSVSARLFTMLIKRSPRQCVPAVIGPRAFWPIQSGNLADLRRDM